MASTMTLRTAADLFNDLDGVLDPQEREARYQKLRAIVQAGMVTSDVAVSRGKTAAFSDAKLAQLRLLQALIDSGIKGPVLWRFNAHLTTIPLRPGAKSKAGTAIALAVEEIRRCEEWDLAVRVTRSLLTGELEFQGTLKRADEPENPASREILDSGRVIYSHITLPATALIRPVLDRLDEVQS